MTAVELKSCPGIHGTVTGFKRGSVHVRFDDFLDARSILRPGSFAAGGDRQKRFSRERKFSMSSKGFWITQDGHFVHIIPPVSAGAAQTGVRFNLAMWGHASLVIRFGATGGPAGAITLNVYKALSGGSGVAIPFKYAIQNAASAPFDVFNEWAQATASGVTPTNVANETIVIELDVDDILVANNGSYVELDIAAGSLGSSAQVLDAFGILSAGRFASDLETSVQV